MFSFEFLSTSEGLSPQQLVSAASLLQRQIENEGALRFSSDAKTLELALRLLNNPANGLSKEDQNKLLNLSNCVVGRVAEEMKWSRLRKIASAVYRVFQGGTSRPITLFKLLPPEEMGKVVEKLKKEYEAVFTSKEGDDLWDTWKWVRRWKCETLKNSIEDMSECVFDSKNELIESNIKGAPKEEQERMREEITENYKAVISAISQLGVRIKGSVKSGEYARTAQEDTAAFRQKYGR